MRVETIVSQFFLAIATSLCVFGNVAAHGGVVQEEDLCVIKVNFLRAHFKIYQPRASGHEQFCEDLPVASESVFVMEYEHSALENMLIDFRIIRDVTGKGRFARMEDIQRIDDLDSVTVFYEEAVIDPDVFTVLHDFADEGDFVGIVTATQPDTNKVYAAVFPFEVGFSGIGYWPFFILLLLLLQFQYLLMSGRLKRWTSSDLSRAAGVSILCALLVTPVTGAHASDADVVVTYSVPAGAPEINRMHSWILHVESADGAPIEGAKILVDGGMPEHDHGLPTKPRVTAELGDGDYRLDGMRFHMRGFWEISVTVTTDKGESVVVIPLRL